MGSGSNEEPATTDLTGYSFLPAITPQKRLNASPRANSCSEKKRLDMRYSVIVMYNTTEALSLAHDCSEGGEHPLAARKV